MTRAEAIIELMQESRRPRGSTAAAKRAVRACKTLGLAADDIRHVMSWLDYCDRTTGEPHAAAGVKRVWP